MQHSSKTRIMTMALLAAVGFGLGWVVVADEPTGGAIEMAPPVTESPAVDAPPPSATMTVTGTIEAVEKSLLGKVEQVRIVSPELGSFLIEPSGKGEELKELVGEQVTVVAQRKTDAQGRTTLAVERYQLEQS